MSTELKSITGEFHNKRTNKKDQNEMSLTRFSGGKEGMKIQLTLNTTDQDQFFTHICLNKHEIKELISELLKALYTSKNQQR
jgi:hypothetical protein